MSTPRSLEKPLSLKIVIGVFLAFWLLIAAFPLVRVAVMSFKLPVDALATNPLQVLVGPGTRAQAGGLSLLDIALGAIGLWAL